MVVEEGLTRTWPRWTMHQRRTSQSLGVEEPDIMEKGKWMFNLWNQANHKESHITKCQSLLNQDMKWLGDQKWKLIIRCEVLQVTTFNAEARPNVATLMKWKRNEVVRINFMQTQVEEKYFIFNLEYRNAALSRGIAHGLPRKSQYST
jgi:hypothetical protein